MESSVTDARNATINSVGRDQINLVFIVTPAIPIANSMPASETPKPGPSAYFKNRNSAAQSAQKAESDKYINLTDNTLSISAIVLDALRHASQFMPCSLLRMAASTTLSIVQQAQGGSGVNSDFQHLVKDACDTVYIALIVHKAQGSEDSELSKSLDSTLEDLFKTLTSIDEYARKQARRSSVKRFLMLKSDIAKISEYRERLNHALNIFWLQSSIHVRDQLSHIAMQQGITPVYDHSNFKSDRLAPRRIGADNDSVYDSFDEADMGNTTNIRATGDIASGNTDLTRAFNQAQMGNTLGSKAEQVSSAASFDQTVYTTIASHNHHLQDVFGGAVMGNTSAAQSSISIASGNKNMFRSFNGARMGVSSDLTAPL
ncbi:hypothetical protein PILCRDRAFT_810733 [Piloderma croceum F 1598]|uniref:Uncharacterized protein n=1 Tax=Piloderma croceum (strain F 1598) TaxID=765440 RepID=A0A0C3CP04_PILCF|nr:hypothetical protein PILCRDRAFT_810733 [Piloderma croceum F 1598]